MKKYKYLFFDLDGTIVDTYEGITRSFAYALDHFGIKVKSFQELTPVIGPPLRDSFIEMFGFSESKAAEAVGKYRERYNKFFIKESKLYPHIKDIIQKLYELGYCIVLATSKPEHFANALLQHYGLTQYFSYIGAATLDKSRDSKIKVLEHIISNLGIRDLSEAVMIGDTKFDLLGAEQIGIEAIGVLYGFGKEEELEKYPNVYLAKDAKDLYNYIVND